MSESQTMKEIRETRERISKELSSLSEKDFLKYFRNKRPEWATETQILEMEKVEEDTNQLEIRE